MLYPPVLEKSAPAFLASIPSYKIFFQLPSFIGYNDFGHIQIKISSQNGTLIGNYPDKLIYKDKSLITTADNSITLNCAEDLTGWVAGQVYKIQMRLGEGAYNPASSAAADFNAWKMGSMGAVSEWSNIMIVKALEQPIVQIANESGIEAATSPIFYGSVSMPEINNEIVDKVKYDIYEGNEFLESSNWVMYTGGSNSHRFKQKLEEGKSYFVYFSIHTLNDYKQTSLPYRFRIIDTALNQLTGITFAADATKSNCGESGHIGLYLGFDEAKSGIFVISRTSEKSNYSVWEDIKVLRYYRDIAFDEVLVHKDFLVEDGIKYKYAIQQEVFDGTRSISIETNPVSVDYENVYLSDGKHQLNLMYDTKLTSFKKTVLASKQDSLGSAYPIILRNGAAYYAEFPISGLISLNQDLGETTFLEKKVIYDDAGKPIEYQYYFDDELLFSLEEEYILNLPRKEQIRLEKIFRDKVESFLNDGGYKIYRSSTEGNFIITLMNISLTPQQSLGRMIYSFSATAYEVAPFDFEFLKQMGMLDLTTEEKDAKEVIYENNVGQLTNSNEDVADKIAEEIEVLEKPEGYSNYYYTLSEITSITVSTERNITLEVNGVEHLILSNRVYTLNSKEVEINSVKIKDDNADGTEIQYSYIVKLIPLETISKIVYFTEWGQVDISAADTNTDILGKITTQIQDNVRSKYSSATAEINKFEEIILQGEPNTELALNGVPIFLGLTGFYELSSDELFEIEALTLSQPASLMVDYICVVKVQLEV